MFVRSTVAALGLTLLAAAAVAFARDGGTVWAGVYTEAQASRGQATYREACASCHGDTLGGGEMAPALAGTTFQENWTGQTLRDVFARMRTMPPSDPGSLPRDKAADVLAYVLKENGFPAGATELTSSNSDLEVIAIAPKSN